LQDIIAWRYILFTTKELELAQFKLQENITKYMKYMEFIRSSSPLTLRHYLLDLRQAFSPTPESPRIESLPKTLSEAEVLSTARAAFNGPWSRLSLASRNRKAATLKSFFGWAFDNQLLEKDLATQITCPKVPRKLPHFLSVDEILSVLKTFKRSSTEELREEVLFLLLYGGGLRVSEACNLKWSEVQLTQRVLRVRGKGNKERVIVLPRLCQQALETLRKVTPEDFIFGSAALGTRRAYTIIHERGIQADLLQSLHPHALRHSFATHLLSSGANLRTLQEMLGHESLQATEKYTHLGIDQLARTMESMHPLGKGRKSG
jgi:site-specific recombinase XerD